MKPMTSAEAREAFLSYFEKQGHKRVASSSLVPGNDPTLLFANAGMVQFKETFLGLEKRDYNRATTAQKCLRVSGKHNDIEEVGPSNSHHTFFEMMGNFSFGDYFKRDAIRYAWELITEVYKMPIERLAVTIYYDDDEAYNLWIEETGISPKRIARLGAKNNFWQMAETGPCGPSSEIHWDVYPERGEDDIIPSLEADDGRFLEFWNLVFMQFEREKPDPENTGKHDKLLPAPSVDTGMGLERIVSILQQVDSNYETDIFMPIIEFVQALIHTSDNQRDENIVPYRVIADHTRAAVFLISDGVLPGAKGRDSVCRLVIRRAARFGKKLGFNEPFLGEVARSVIDVMGGHYTELVEKTENIIKVITQEEVRFHRTLDRGLGELSEMIETLEANGQDTLPGKEAFYLKATMGLPLEVINDIAGEHGIRVDLDGFRAEEERHSEVSGGGQAMGAIASGEVYSDLLAQLRADGTLSENGVAYDPYGPTQAEAKVIALLQNGQPVESAIVGDKVEIVLDSTPFYVEAGGQVSDTGTLTGEGWSIEIEDTTRPVSGLVVHLGEVVEGTPRQGDSVTATVDQARRDDITRNHTGTHLLHAALRKRLGTHVQQRGSLVAPDRLRFDFAHDEKVSPDALHAIEQEINEIILANYPVRSEVKSLKQAQSEGAMALFGEKYGDEVRTIIIDNGTARYSYELCGGVHVRETAEIGLFVLVSEGSVSAGIRRIEALTGRAALAYINGQLNQLHQIAQQLGTSSENAAQRVNALQDELSTTKKELSTLRRELARHSFDAQVAALENINGVPVLISQVNDVTMDNLREMSDWFRNRVESGVLVLGSVVDGKPQLLATVSDDLTKRGLHAGNLIREIAQIVGGGGGGRPNMAQAGGKDISKLPEALTAARQIITDAT